MTNSKPPSFKTALDFDARQLSISLEKIAEQKALLAIVRTALPQEISDHVQHCVSSGKALIVYTSSASWASQIRFFSMGILNKITEYGQQNISSVQVRVVPQLMLETSKRIARLPSQESLDLLNKQIHQTKSHDILEQALSRLAKTLENRLKAKQ